MLNLLHKKCKLGRGGTYYVRGQMPKNANVICEGYTTFLIWPLFRGWGRNPGKNFVGFLVRFIDRKRTF